MTVDVEPGVVLDALNAWLKPHGVWFPVDVSTSAQATIGGMAGNNSCGSRSIAYGNMVHNVLAIEATLSDGTEARFGPEAEMARAPPRIAEILRVSSPSASESAARSSATSRRCCAASAATTSTSLVRRASVRTRPTAASTTRTCSSGSEGTLAWSRKLTLKLSPLPVHRTLGVVNFPTLYKAMESARHLVELSPSAVELVDRTMIDLARGNPAFRAVIDSALVGEPDAILLVEFSGESRDDCVRRLSELTAARRRTWACRAASSR